MGKKIDIDEVLVACGFGQHEKPQEFHGGCHACVLASFKKLVEILNKEDD